MESAVRTPNRLIDALPDGERDNLIAELDTVKLGQKEVLAKPHEPFTHIHFPTTAVISLVQELEDGDGVEVATIGNEGVIGVPVVLGAAESPTNVFNQIPGEALRIRTAAFVPLLERLPALNRLLRRYAQSMMNQIAQTAACNHAHDIEQRMCRWLLLTHDRAGRDEFPLTQEFLAQMLGVRRPSVTMAGGMLQKAGLIRYSRGQITIVDRAGLEAVACECYRVVKKEHDRLTAG